MEFDFWKQQNNLEIYLYASFFQQDIDADTKLAIWKIEEETAFF